MEKRVGLPKLSIDSIIVPRLSNKKIQPPPILVFSLLVVVKREKSTEINSLSHNETSHYRVINTLFLFKFFLKVITLLMTEIPLKGKARLTTNFHRKQTLDKMNQRTQLNDWDKAEKSEHEDVPQWPPPPSLKKLREREKRENNSSYY